MSGNPLYVVSQFDGFAKFRPYHLPRKTLLSLIIENKNNHIYQMQWQTSVPQLRFCTPLCKKQRLSIAYIKSLMGRKRKYKHQYIS